MRSSSYHATRDGDTAFSLPTYVCRYCSRGGLFWGPHEGFRRLFEAHDRVHSCLPKKEQRCHCTGFDEFMIPVEFYDPMEFEPWRK